MFADFLPYKTANTNRIYIYVCNVNSANMHVEIWHLTPPGWAVNRCDVAAGELSPPACDRSGTTSSISPPEDLTENLRDYSPIIHQVFMA